MCRRLVGIGTNSRSLCVFQQGIAENLTFGIETDKHFQITTETARRTLYGSTEIFTLGILRRVNPVKGDYNAFMLPAGGILMAVGIGLFISYFVSKKMLAKEIEAEEKALEEQQK